MKRVMSNRMVVLHVGHYVGDSGLINFCAYSRSEKRD